MNYQIAPWACDCQVDLAPYKSHVLLLLLLIPLVYHLNMIQIMFREPSLPQSIELDTH